MERAIEKRFHRIQEDEQKRMDKYERKHAKDNNKETKEASEKGNKNKLPTTEKKPLYTGISCSQVGPKGGVMFGFNKYVTLNHLHIF